MSWTAPRTWTTGELVTAAIMNAHVRDNLLETAPATVTTAGDLVYATAANALARRAIGTAYQELRTNSGATAPEWFTPPSVKVNNSGAQTIANSSATILTWDTENYDSATMHSTVSNTSRLTVPIDGIYLVSGQVFWVANATGRRMIKFFPNGNAANRFAQSDASGGGGSPDDVYQCHALVNLSAGAYVEMQVWQSSGGNLDVQAALSSFAAQWVGKF